MGDQLDLHRDSVGELWMRSPECTEFHDLARSWRTGRGASGRISEPTLSQA
jgi:hypothetical protein